MSTIDKRLEIGDSGKLQEVRFFSDTALQASIGTALAKVTDAKTAILQLEKNPSGFNAAVAANLDGHWSIAVAYKRDGWGDSLGTNVKFAW